MRPMGEPHPNIRSRVDYRVERPGLAGLFLRARPGGDGTAYRLDPRLVDPGPFSKWDLRRTPRGLTMVGRLPLGSMYAILGVLAVALIVIWSLCGAGILGLGDAIFWSIVPGVGLAGGSFGLSLARKHKDRRGVVLAYDAHSRGLEVHGEGVDLDRVEAVERVAVAHGARTTYRKQRQVTFSTAVHLVLRERLDDPEASDPSSLEPGVRFRVVAVTALGLSRHGPAIAERIGKPYRRTHLGVVATHQVIEDEASAEAARERFFRDG